MITREITIKESKGTFSIFKKSSSNREDYDFSGISALRQVLNNQKARILDVIKKDKPKSIYSLSKKLGRNFKSVYQDIKLLERFGVVQLIEEKTNKRVRFRPKLTAETITIHLKI